MAVEIVFKRGSRGDWVLLIQRLLNAPDFTKNGRLAEDGYYGPATEQKVKQFQNFRGLMTDGIVGTQTFEALITSSMDFASELKQESSKYLSEQNIIHAAKVLDVDVATIKAVIEVESAGSGFVGNKPKILFEGHVFWRRLQEYGKNPELYDGYDDVLYKSWTKEFYKGGLAEYNRLDKAKEIHTPSALESCSWGLFQIMGYHWQALGYRNIQEFVNSMFDSEGQQLFAFLRYVKVNDLVGYLKGKDWSNFARAYNGELFYENQYDIRLRDAYEKYNTKEVFT